MSGWRIHCKQCIMAGRLHATSARLQMPNTSAADQTIIELSRKKIGLIILGSCAFVAIGAWLFQLDDAAIRSFGRFRDPTIVHGVGLASIAFFGLCALAGLRKLFDRKPGLVLNSSGIIDNSSAISAGLIPWTEIKGAEIFEVSKQKMLIIKVTNPEKYVARANWLKQATNKASQSMCGSSISISANSLKISFPELLSIFNQYQQRYGKAG